MAPTYHLPDGRGEVSLSLRQRAKRFADLGNTVALPAYRTVDLSGRYDLTGKWTLNASVNNLTDEIGLTEGTRAAAPRRSRRRAAPTTSSPVPYSAATCS